MAVSGQPEFGAFFSSFFGVVFMQQKKTLQFAGFLGSFYSSNQGVVCSDCGVTLGDTSKLNVSVLSVGI